MHLKQNKHMEKRGGRGDLDCCFIDPPVEEYDGGISNICKQDWNFLKKDHHNLGSYNTICHNSQAEIIQFFLPLLSSE